MLRALLKDALLLKNEEVLALLAISHHVLHIVLAEFAYVTLVPL